MQANFLKRFISRTGLNIITSLLSRPAIVARILQLLDERKEGSTALYVYHKELDVLRYVPSLERVYNNYKKGTATDSDEWMRILPDLIPVRCKTIFDVGVNFGHTAAWFSSIADNVYAFEPDPDNQLRIIELLGIRNINNVTLVNTAISDFEGTSDFHIKAFSGQNSLADIDSGDYIKTIKVAVTSIDHVCDKNRIEHISLLKIDVEGYEPEVLYGAQTMLKNQRIDFILFEHSPGFYLQRSLKADVALRYLNKMGYDVFDMNGKSFYFEGNNQQQIDLLAKKRN